MLKFVVLAGTVFSIIGVSALQFRPTSSAKPQPAPPLVKLEPVRNAFLESQPAPGNAILIERTDKRKELPARQPVTISRVFAEGEFPESVQASVEGVVLQTQCDVKTRWPDGSLRHALLSFWVDFSSRKYVQVDFVSQPNQEPAGFLDRTAMLSFMDAKWGGRLEASASVPDGSSTSHCLRPPNPPGLVWRRIGCVHPLLAKGPYRHAGDSRGSVACSSLRFRLDFES